MRFVEVPAGSLLKAKYGAASYQDCFMQPLARSEERGPVGLFFKMFHPVPVWVSALMRLRNFIVGFLGLETTSGAASGLQKPEADYQVGDKIDFFKIVNLSENEVIVTANDTHLDSSFSLYLDEKGGETMVYMTSVVETKGRLGGIYMFVIAPFHRLIVRQLLKRLS